MLSDASAVAFIGLHIVLCCCSEQLNTQENMQKGNFIASMVVTPVNQV